MEQHKKDTQECLTIANDSAALSCLKKVVAKYSGSDVCQPKLVLLVQDGCVPCKEETALHADDIAKGIVNKININSPEGIAIAAKNKINLIPSLILLDCQDNLIFPD